MTRAEPNRVGVLVSGVQQELLESYEQLIRFHLHFLFAAPRPGGTRAELPPRTGETRMINKLLVTVPVPLLFDRSLPVPRRRAALLFHLRR